MKNKQKKVPPGIKLLCVFLIAGILIGVLVVVILFCTGVLPPKKHHNPLLDKAFGTAQQSVNDDDDKFDCENSCANTYGPGLCEASSAELTDDNQSAYLSITILAGTGEPYLDCYIKSCINANAYAEAHSLSDEMKQTITDAGWALITNHDISEGFELTNGITGHHIQYKFTPIANADTKDFIFKPTFSNRAKKSNKQPYLECKFHTDQTNDATWNYT